MPPQIAQEEDVKIEAEEQPSSGVQDVNSDSASEQEGASPSEKEETDQTAPAKEPTLADVAKTAYEKATKAAEGEVDGKKNKSSIQELNPTEEQKPAENHDPVPYTRYQEQVQKRQDLESRYAAAEPKVKWADGHEAFLRTNGITQQDFVAAMNILALQKSDPAKAREALRPIWEQLKEFDENALPADLAKRVEEEELTPSVAKEMAALRAQNKRHDYAQKANAQRQQEMLERASGNAISTWDQARRGSDPDFKPKESDASPDGLWELTAKNFAYLQTTKFATTPQDIVSHLESAYKQAKGLLSSFASRIPSTRKPLTSSRSSGPTKKKRSEMTTREVAAEVAAAHGINWNPSSGEDDDD